jgi:hypothetical protein
VQTSLTTTGQRLAIWRDWSGFTIVDRLGAQMELIPHLFGATNRFPTGAARDLAIFVGYHQAERAALSAQNCFLIISGYLLGTHQPILVVIESC